MITVVYTTSGGTRFHWDRRCRALAAGRVLSLRQGEEGVYPVAGVDATAAALTGYTACRVCVPPALALPLTGQTYGHEPVNMWPDGLVCARCYTETRHAAYGEPEDVKPERWTELHLVLWPCTSAVVLGLVARDGA